MLSFARGSSIPTTDFPPLGGGLGLDPAIPGGQPRRRLDSIRCSQGPLTWFSSGRSAFHALLTTLHRTDSPILLPDYLCGNVLLDVVEGVGLSWHTYPVLRDLSCDLDALEKLCGSLQPSVVLVIDYFGMTDPGPALECIGDHAPGAARLLDLVQNPWPLLDEGMELPPCEGIFASLRKLLPVPDGAPVWSAQQLVPPRDRVETGEAWLGAALLKHARQTGRSGPEVEGLYLDLFRAGDRAVSTAALAPSSLGVHLLERLDLEAEEWNRRENALVLAGDLGSLPGVEHLGEWDPTGAPLAFPVMVDPAYRDEVRARLAHEGIYCAVHWPLDPRLRSSAGSGAVELYESELSLPVSGGMDSAGNERLLDTLRRLFGPGCPFSTQEEP